MYTNDNNILIGTTTFIIPYSFSVHAQYKTVMNNETRGRLNNYSVSDPLHIDADPDPRIRFRDNGSGSDLNSNKF